MLGPCLVSGAISTELLEGVYGWPKLIGSSQGGPAAAKTDKGQFPSDHMTVKPRKALRTMQTSLMLTNVTQLTREERERSKSPSSAGRDAVVHLPATFLSVIRRKVATCCDDLPFPTPSTGALASLVVAPLIPLSLSYLANSEARELKQADGKAGQPFVRVNISRFRGVEEKKKEKTKNRS